MHALAFFVSERFAAMWLANAPNISLHHCSAVA
jgi:hypothetical protein